MNARPTGEHSSEAPFLILIDGHAMIHRAFHAIPESLTNNNGEHVNATFGFTSMLMKALIEFQPDYIAVTFDRPSPTFRHRQFADYKAQRPPLPDIMKPQFERIHEIVQAFNIPIYAKDGFEADDVIGTLSVQATQQDIDTVILTGDMDTLQLVNEHVRVMIAKRGITDVTTYDNAAVEERYGFVPQKLPDFKGLVGDRSDNIPGVPGIGEKTAQKLIEDYGNLEGILVHIDELKPKVQQLLRESFHQARQSRDLATIVLDAPVQLDVEACRVDHLTPQNVLHLFRELEFRTLVDKLGEIGPISNNSLQYTAPAKSSIEEYRGSSQDIPLQFAPPIGIVAIMSPPVPPVLPSSALHSTHYKHTSIAEMGEETGQEEPTQLHLFAGGKPATETAHAQPTQTTDTMVIADEQALHILIGSLRQAGAFALDTETTSEDPWHAELVGLSCAIAPGEAFYIPVGHTHSTDHQEPGVQLPVSFVLEQLRPILEDGKIKKYMHNAKYDMLVIARYAIAIQGLAFDTMLGAYLVDPGRRGIGLKDQVFQRLGHVMTPISQLIGSGSKMIGMAQVPIRRAADYAGADADMTLRLVEPITNDLHRHSLAELYSNVELPLTPVLMEMEMQGVALDADFLRHLAGTLSDQIHTLEKSIYDTIGHQFNINSPKQLGDILFGELGLPKGKKTKTGFSVSANVIEGLRGRHPMVDYLLEYRQLSKLKSTYVDGLLALVDPSTGRVHTSFNQVVASSGRLSSSNPNLQNIPIRTEVGRQIRRAFIAEPGYTLLTADYSQFELRILAYITSEPRLVEGFSKDEDIHTITASSLFGIPASDVTKDQRRLAKTVVYAILYGQSAFGLAQITGMSNSEAADFITRYHETFPHIKKYVDSTLNQAHMQGYVNTFFGRKRFMPDMHSLPPGERQALEREAINMPIQGANADLIKIAMIRIHHALKLQKLHTRMILQVHDELVFEVPTNELEHTSKLIRAHMQEVVDLHVPIKVEMKVGKNWYEAELV